MPRVPGPKKCFKGKVSSINNFYADATKPYTQGQGVTFRLSFDGKIRKIYNAGKKKDQPSLEITMFIDGMDYRSLFFHVFPTLIYK